MSDIVIRGIKMPDCCYHCFALDDNGDYPRCLITQEQRGYTFQTREKRMDKCPLIALPEGHGRLIDADALSNNQYDFFTHSTGCVRDRSYQMMVIIQTAPTIIPAEKEAET